MGAHNSFARITMDQLIEEKVNKNTQTPSGTKGYGQWYATLLLQTTCNFILFFFFVDAWRNYNLLPHG